ncbi:lipid II:glycine glycyltransferase FemX [Rhodococcus sp. NPDC003318]|uniref:lipid II:glycine glycyltransferase FemX n=1 Tax=Rhodococcus sp. NPDC003318 TaxID=3364503 RepID=UPI003698B152
MTVSDQVGVVREANPLEVERWDEHVTRAADGGDVWRGQDNAKAKETLGYAIRYLFVGDDAVTVHVKNVPLLGPLWIVPSGPSGATIAEVLPKAQALAFYAATQGAFVLRIDPRVEADAETTRRLLAEGYRPAGQVTPNKHTVIVDLDRTEDEILAGFSKGARRALKRAARDGVQVERVPATDENCDILYELVAQTGDGRFGVRSREYSRFTYQRYAASGNGQMFFARSDGKVATASFEMRLGAKAIGLHKGSVRKSPGDSATNGLGSQGIGHALQWAVVRWAKEAGALEYDLCGTPPSAEADNPDHYFYGIGTFKRSFNREITDYVGAWDVPLSQWRNRIWTAGYERECKRLSMLLRRTLFY